MKIIVINAAPRMKAGNTQMILNPLLAGLRHAGAHVDVAFLARKTIEPSIGCFTCFAQTPGECIHRDDMRGLNETIRAAEMMVLATPIYIDGMTSLAKTFCDRLVTFLDPHFIKDDERIIHPLRWKFPKGLFLLSVCGFPGLDNFAPLLLHMERLARNFHSHFVGSLLRPAVSSVLMTRKYPDRVRHVLDAVRKAGEELVRNGAVSEATFHAAAADVCTPGELMKMANAYWDQELESSRNESS